LTKENGVGGKGEQRRGNVAKTLPCAKGKKVQNQLGPIVLENKGGEFPHPFRSGKNGGLEVKKKEES